ncbi:ABC transporter substrate-binding protein [Achromobacter pestifer]|uniref:ABC transporter substrate-binding protein n=1 Tax=Achromobacter pestifer TaxID=1353889 RepID=A0A7D4ILV1_9BURK|nr:ABC transporter substrate-binding protein [Achromobacter pestifer]QKH38523.1 ABC transporter substrate-binding protein [Achromobacter pestifer]
MQNVLPKLLLLGILLMGSPGSATAQPSEKTNADAKRVATALLAIASPQKETKQAFAQRVGPSFKRLVATETMTRVVLGPAWRTMSPSRQAEAVELYGRFLMRTLHGAFEGPLPSQFALESGEMFRSKPSSIAVIQITCLALKMADCIYYSAKSKAREFTMEFQRLYIDGRWRVVEIYTSGLSVQQTYHSSFSSIIKSSSVEKFLEKLRARVDS